MHQNEGSNYMLSIGESVRYELRPHKVNANELNSLFIESVSSSSIL